MLYRFILADPPWQHNDRKAVRKDNPQQKTRLGMGAAGHYRTEPTSVICDLGVLVQAVATADAYLAMWVVESMPQDVPRVLEAWGFEQVCTLFAWMKTNSKAGTPCFGNGKYSAGNLGTQTKLYMTGNIRSWITYCQLRCSPATQLEHREIAFACRAILLAECPELEVAFEPA